jgi:hypothetical protein
MEAHAHLADPGRPETLTLPRRCPNCGLEIPRGQSRCPACAAAFAPPAGGSAGPPLGGSTGIGPSEVLASAAGSLLTTLAVFPQALGWVGWAAAGEAIERSAALRGALFLAGLVVMAISSLARARRARARLDAAWAEFASRTGGTLTQEPRSLSGQGWGGGPTVRASVGDWTVTLETLRQRSSSTVRMSARVAARQDFFFLVCGRSLAGRLVTSPKLWSFVLSRAAKTAGSGAALPGGPGGPGAPAGPAAPESLARLTYMTGPDVPTGDPEFDSAFIVKTSSEGTARELFGDSGLRRRLLDLRAAGKGSVFTLAPLPEPGTALLEFQDQGMPGDVERMVAVHGLLAATLQALAQAGAISERSAASA